MKLTRRQMFVAAAGCAAAAPSRPIFELFKEKCMRSVASLRSYDVWGPIELELTKKQFGTLYPIESMTLEHIAANATHHDN